MKLWLERLAVIDSAHKNLTDLTTQVTTLRDVLANKQKGKIIQIASLLSFQGGIRVPSYTAAKSGLAGVTKLMANEWAAKGVNVNAIAPGYIVTNNTEALRKDETRSRDILARIVHIVVPADRHRGELGQIADDHLGRVHQLGGELPELGVAAGSDRQAAALRREVQGDPPADAASRPRDHRGFQLLTLTHDPVPRSAENEEAPRSYAGAGP